MVDRTEVVFNDSRENFRVTENRRVSWLVKDSNLKGQGKVRNISTTGMLMETDFAFEPQDDIVFSFDADLGPRNFIPQSGRLVWHKQKNSQNNKFLWGIQFLEPAEFVLVKLRQRIQKGVKKFSKLQTVQNVGNFCLFTVIIGLTGYVVWMCYGIYGDLITTNQRLASAVEQQSALTQSYAHRYYASELKILSLQDELVYTKAQYQESESMVVSVNKELESTKAILKQTETMLAEAQRLNAELHGEVTSATQLGNVNSAEAQRSRTEFENTIALLEEQNVKLSNEMKILQKDLNFYTGDIQSAEEGRKFIKTYKDRMKLVKFKLRHFKKEANAVKKAAQVEKDRIRLELGNNGYFIKNGNTVFVDSQKYHSEVLGGSSKLATENQPVTRKPVVDVTFVD